MLSLVDIHHVTGWLVLEGSILSHGCEVGCLSCLLEGHVVFEDARNVPIGKVRGVLLR